MDCIDLKIPIILVFGISIVAANIAGSKMEKEIKPEAKEKLGMIPKWKLIFGDVFLPSDILTERGILWRKLSILFFVCVVLSGAAVPFSQSQEWVCNF